MRSRPSDERAHERVARRPLPAELVGAAFGFPPTYYGIQAQEVFVSSSFSALRDELARRGIRFHFDLDWFAGELLYIHPWDASPYQEIRRVPPAHRLWIAKDGATRVVPDLEVLSPIFPTAQEAAECVRNLFEVAVRRRIEDREKVVVVTGGGMDSSAVASMAVLLQERGLVGEVRCVSAHVAEEGDDRPFMGALCQRLRTTPVRFFPEDAIPWLLRPELDGLWNASPNGTIHMLARGYAKQWSADICLSGISGDQLFDGDARVHFERFRRHPMAGLLGAARVGGFPLPGVTNKLEHYIYRPGRVALANTSLVRAYRRRRSRTGPAWAGPATMEYLRKSARRAEAPSAWSTPAERRFEWSTFHGLAAAGFWAMQLDQAMNLSSGFPYQDEDLVRYLACLPPEMFFEGERARGLFRVAFRDLLPEVLSDRSTKAEFVNWMKVGIREAGRDPGCRTLARAEICEKLGLANGSEVQRVWESEKADSWQRVLIWPVLCMERYLRETSKYALAV